MTIRQRFQGYPIVSVGEEELGEGPIYYQGWDKYFVILGKSKINERRFLINSQFELQNKIPLKEMKNKEVIIPDNLHFYFMLNDDYLSVVDSKIV